MMKEWLKAKQRGDDEREENMDVIGELMPDKVCLFEPCTSSSFYLMSSDNISYVCIADKIMRHYYHAFPTFFSPGAYTSIPSGL